MEKYKVKKISALPLLFIVGFFGTSFSQVKPKVQEPPSQEKLEIYTGILLANDAKISQGEPGTVKTFRLRYHELEINDSIKYPLYKISKDIAFRDIQNGTQYFKFEENLVGKTVRVHGLLSKEIIYSVWKVEPIGE